MGVHTGTATITAGLEYVDVPHGFATTPDIDSIYVTPLGDLLGYRRKLRLN
jgi:hypothetical protein